MKLRGYVWAVVAALVVFGAAARAEAPSVLLEKGVYTEETVGNLEEAIQIYQEVLGDAEAKRTTLAQAHYRLATCYLRTGRRSQAVEELDKILVRYPDETAVVSKAQPLLDSLVIPDPATLMPPHTLLYQEMGSPGEQVEKVLNMLKGTPFANPLEAMGGAQGPAGKSPGDIMAALFNPSMIEEFKKVRGIAFGITDLQISGASTSASTVVVIYPGRSDALRGLITAGISIAGQPAAPIEGMQTIRFGQPSGGCAFDKNAIIIANPFEALTWSVKQYKGVTNEPSLASANAAFARLSHEVRRTDALTIWVDASRALPALRQGAEAAGEGEAFAKVDSFANLSSISEVMVRVVVDEKDPFVEGAVVLKEGQPCPAYSLFSTPNLTTGGFGAVPENAVAVASIALNEANEAQAEAARGVLSRLTGLDIGRDVLGNIEQVTLFVLPASGAAANDVLGQVSPLLPGVGVAISSRSPAQTHLLADRLLAAGEALVGLPEPAGAPAQALPSGVTRHALFSAGGQPVWCYIGQAGKSTVLGLSAETVQAAVQAVKDDRSALAGGPFRAALGALTPSTSKLLLVHAGGAIEAAASQMRSSGSLPEEEGKVMSQLAEALALTTLELRSEEMPAQVVVRFGLHGVPPLGGVFPLVSRLSELRRPAAPAALPAPEPVAVSYAPGPVTVDGDLSEWASIAPAPTVENQLPLAPFKQLPLAPFKLCWREDGLYGAVYTADSLVQADLNQPWMNDGLQVFVDPRNERTTQQTENCFQFALLPLPDQGPGRAWVDVSYMTVGRYVKAAGVEPDSGIEGAWKRTEIGYTLEFHIPARTLQPAAMEPGTVLGLMMMLRDGSAAPVAWFTAGTGSDAYQRPDKWGAVRLVKEAPAAAAPAVAPGAGQ